MGEKGLKRGKLINDNIMNFITPSLGNSPFNPREEDKLFLTEHFRKEKAKEKDNGKSSMKHPFLAGLSLDRINPSVDKIVYDSRRYCDYDGKPTQGAYVITDEQAFCDFLNVFASNINTYHKLTSKAVLWAVTEVVSKFKGKSIAVFAKSGRPYTLIAPGNDHYFISFRNGDDTLTSDYELTISQASNEMFREAIHFTPLREMKDSKKDSSGNYISERESESKTDTDDESKPNPAPASRVPVQSAETSILGFNRNGITQYLKYSDSILPDIDTILWEESPTATFTIADEMSLLAFWLKHTKLPFTPETETFLTSLFNKTSGMKVRVFAKSGRVGVSTDSRQSFFIAFTNLDGNPTPTYEIVHEKNTFDLREMSSYPQPYLVTTMTLKSVELGDLRHATVKPVVKTDVKRDEEWVPLLATDPEREQIEHELRKQIGQTNRENTNERITDLPIDYTKMFEGMVNYLKTQNLLPNFKVQKPRPPQSLDAFYPPTDDMRTGGL
jgi:hypothetical protein